MPGGDGTGPLGYGSRTGRGLGNCAPYSNAPENNERPNERPIYGLGRGGLPRGGGRGFGFGGGRGPGFGAGREFGRGMGWQNQDYSRQTQEEEGINKKILEKLDSLENTIKEMNKKE